MKRFKPFSISVLLAGLAFLLSSCPNPLLTQIEETVEVAVTPPGITAIYPTLDATDIPINLDVITITFTKEILASSVTSGTFKVIGPDGTAVTGTFDISNDTVTFEPSGNLEYDTEYTIIVTANVRDIDGNGLPEEYTWTFRTGLAPDNTKPTGLSITFNGGVSPWATSADVTLEVLGSDNYGIAQMNISDTGSFSDSNWVTYNADPGTGAATVNWTLPGGGGTKTVYAKFKDGAGNVSDAAVSGSIDLDTSDPIINDSGFLINGGAGSTNELTISISIAAEDSSSSGVVDYMYWLSTDPQPTTWDLLTAEGTAQISFDLPATAGEGDTFTFYVIARDLAGNPADTSTPTASAQITFDTQPPEPPTEMIPVAANTNVPYDASYVEVFFEEEMNPATIFPDSFYVVKSGDVTRLKDLNGDDFEISYSNSETNDNSIFRISGITFEPNTTYFVTLGPTIADVAGNEMGTEETWFFATSDATDQTAPEATTTIATLTGALSGEAFYNMVYSDGALTGVAATNHDVLELLLDATDDYNSVYGMNIWGEGIGPPLFEDTTAWVPFSSSVPWTIDSLEGEYNLWYRLQDSKGNKTLDPPINFRVIYDITSPTVENIDVTNATLEPTYGSLHINEVNGRVSLLLAANDYDASATPGTGSGVKEMQLSNDGVFDLVAEGELEAWQPWSPIVEEWFLDTVNQYGGPPNPYEKYIYLNLRDTLDQESGTTQITVYYDTEAPQIVFDLDGSDGFTDIIEINEAATQTGTYSDNVTGNLVGNIDDLSYLWEQVGGSGTIIFIPDENVREPIVSADIDDTYVLRLTVTDFAGNSASESIPFIWDTTDPDPMGTVTVSAFSPTATPLFTWDAVPGADTYQYTLDNWSTFDVTDQTSFTPATDLPEGNTTLQVQPFDNAGNSGAEQSAIVFVDTQFPVITNDLQLFLRNVQSPIIYSDGTDGSVSDPGAPTTGSDIDTSSILWTQVDGPSGGTITFTPDNLLDTQIDADIHGNYDIQLSVADNAGNTTVANFTVNWDIEGPDAPVVTGIDHTSNLRPTWSWSSGGNGGYGIYQINLDGGGWVDSGGGGTETFFTPTVDLSDATHTLQVREQDEVGNWSTPGSYDIWVEAGYVAPPEVTVTDGLGTVRNTTSITWSWTTGTYHASPLYRWRVYIDGVLQGGWINPNGASGSALSTDIYIAPTALTEDQIITLEVEEYSTVLGDWVGDLQGKYGANDVRVDRQGPVAPNVTNITTTPTADTTPTWKWTSTAGADGSGVFRFQLDSTGWSGATTSTVYTSGSSLGHGLHTLEVEEQDGLGNWGTAGSFAIDVDIQAPTLTSITIDQGDKYTNGDKHESDPGRTNVRVQIVAGGDAVNMYFLDYEPQSVWEYMPYDNDFYTDLPLGEGTKYVYVKVVDALGNESAYIYDTIIVDQTPPTNVLVTLNQGDTYTPSLISKLSISASDNYASTDEMSIREWRYDTSWASTSTPYTNNMTVDFGFTSSPGTKYGQIYVSDGAGNETSTFYWDTIVMQVPTPTYAYKGTYSSGNTYVYYNSVAEPIGVNSNEYHIYYSTDSTADPNNGDPVTAAFNSSLTNTSYTYAYGFPKGQLLYFWVRAKNDDSGGWGPYSSTNVLGFSSNVTVVYDPAYSADITLANNIKALLEDTDPVPFTTGTRPVWSVTLLPVDLISDTYDGSRNWIYGDPNIFTRQGATHLAFGPSAPYDGKIRNIIQPGRGVIGMWGNAMNVFERVKLNWATWGLGGTKPSYISYYNDVEGRYPRVNAGNDTTAVIRPASTSDSIMTTPLYDYYSNLWSGTYFSTTFFNSPPTTSTYAVLMPTGVNPPDGALYTRDPSTSTYFPVVRQGRFAYYGYNTVPDAANTSTYANRSGQMFFINFIARMDNF